MPKPENSGVDFFWLKFRHFRANTANIMVLFYNIIVTSNKNSYGGSDGTKCATVIVKTNKQVLMAMISTNNSYSIYIPRLKFVGLPVQKI